jgi:transcriptional repressor NrdR
MEDIPHMVIKSDGSRVAFDRTKLLSGLRKACEKRPVPAMALETIADDVERQLSESEEREISTQHIGAHVMAQLRELDQVAYVRFASVYRRFEDIEAFMDEVRNLVTHRS